MSETASSDELSLARYLAQRSDLRFEREALAGDRRPDFTLSSAGGEVVAICEVYSPGVSVPEGGGSFDSVTPTRGAFKQRKRLQGAAAKEARVPYVLVLGSSRSDVNLSEFELWLGGFGGPRKLRSNQNTRYSALAVMSSFNPTAIELERTLDQRLAARGHPRDLASIVEEAILAQESATLEGTFEQDARSVRLDVIHNPWAANPLPLEILGGPFDRQFAVEGEGVDSRTVEICDGIQVCRVVGLVDSQRQEVRDA